MVVLFFNILLTWQKWSLAMTTSILNQSTNILISTCPVENFHIIMPHKTIVFEMTMVYHSVDTWHLMVVRLSLCNNLHCFICINNCNFVFNILKKQSYLQYYRLSQNNDVAKLHNGQMAMDYHGIPWLTPWWPWSTTVMCLNHVWPCSIIAAGTG